MPEDRSLDESGVGGGGVGVEVAGAGLGVGERVKMRASISTKTIINTTNTTRFVLLSLVIARFRILFALPNTCLNQFAFAMSVAVFVCFIAKPE